MTVKLHPLNDLAFVATIRKVNGEGALVALTDDDVVDPPTAFLALSSDPEVEAADATLVSTPSYTGKPGKWLVQFDGSVLVPTLLETLFAATTPWCIIQFQDDLRVAVELVYESDRVITVA